MNTELLNCHRMTTGLLIPTRQFQQAELNKLYANITEQYPYATLQHLPDGIRMANSDNDCIIQGGQPPQPGRLQINDNNIFHFEPAKEKALHLFQMISENLNLHQFLSFGVKLTALLPTGGPSAAEVIENSAFSGFKPVLEKLGPGRQGSGFRVVIHSGGAYDLHIEPFFQDIQNIFIELDVQHHEPISDFDAVEVKMNDAYNFLNEEVREMLEMMG